VQEALIDPVGGGWVASLARPGGNATGFASHCQCVAGSRNSDRLPFAAVQEEAYGSEADIR